MALLKSICTVFGNVFFENVCHDIVWVLTCEVVACRGGEVLVAVATGDHLQVVHLFKKLWLSTLYRQLLLLTKVYKPSMMFTLFSKFFLKSLIFTKMRPGPPGLMRGTGRWARPPSPPACWTNGCPRAPRSVDEVVPDADEQRLDVTDELDTKLGEELARMLFDDVGGLVISTAVKNRTWPVWPCGFPAVRQHQLFNSSLPCYKAFEGIIEGIGEWVLLNRISIVNQNKYC